MTSVPLHIVREDGRVEHLGEWRPHTLVLERAGFPFLDVGEHVIEGDLPWIFWDMCPSGFIGRVYARALQGLRLPADPRTWSANQALEILVHHGADLPGNLVIGEASLAHYQAERADLTKALD
ncbi:MAG: hypothetical protein JNG84_03040, partial [Archangium sp.]|nr:hypothetical protein [Archangium sp.]